MSLNPLSIFYSVPRWELSPSGYIHISWRCDPAAIPAICRAGNFELAGVSRVNLLEVNANIDRLLLADRQLTTVVVTNLYRQAAAQQDLACNNCWFNFITAMTYKAALHTWQRVPKPQQSEDLFERLIAPSLNIQQLLARFDPEYHPNLLVGLQAWTYRVVRYNSFAYLRKNGDPYFGLSNLGIVSRSSWVTIRTALAGNIIATQIDTYKSICKIFKTYLTRSSVSVNNLTLADWQSILVEIRASSIAIKLEELAALIDRIGCLIRAHSSPTIEKYDDPNLFISVASQLDPPPDPDTSDAALAQVFEIIASFISNLPHKSQEMLSLRHLQQLNQVNIAKTMSIDQSQVSRQLGKLYLKLLDRIHTEIPHPDGNAPQQNSQSIAAIQYLIEKYYQRN
ncbi:sigma-70 family RNA polymerase sigma factor [Chamaesiphon sp. VAR_48_metabat_403]|uniref:sigma-70 family RNA polymerase sigma factor n=1 Tax=Chamaesiphon sp. VAR_48_metabat_403 TaxID=2964700 RepID=UPI00286E930E|nr:sigma-70 family RNA polymerase sigma factor [Chamaesiphon sp. VAR_48_metabat_403]